MAMKLSLGDVPLRQQILLFAIVLLGGGYFFYNWYIQPVRVNLAELDGRIQSLEAEIQQVQLVEAQLPKFRREVQEQQERLAQFRATLPSEKETPQLMRSIQRLAVQNNLNIRSFTPQPTVQRDFYVDWPILIAMEGNYHNLASFFEKVGQIPRLVNISELTIRAIEEGESRNRTIGATCTATTFVYLDDEPAAERQGAS